MKPKSFIQKYGRLMIGGFILLIVLLMGVLAPVLTDVNPQHVDPYAKLVDMGVDGHVLGTDAMGRDIFAWLLYGARLSLIVPIGVQIMTIVFGTFIGLICGYYPKLDAILMRIMEALSSIPTIVLCLLICSVLGNGVFNLMISLSAAGFIGVARLIRSRVISLRQEEYIECEKVMGASDFRTLIHHILPACSNTLLVRFSTGLAGSLLSMIGMAFLSCGIDQNTPTWGLMVALGRGMAILKPRLVLIPTIAVALTTFAFSMLGDGMREIIGSGRN